MIRQKALNSQGLTLLELLAAIVIFALLVTVAVPVMLIGVRTYHVGQERSSLHDQVQLASLSLTKELRYAKEVSIVSACPASGFNCIYVNSSSPRSILKKSSTGSSSHYIKDLKGKQSIQVTFSYTTGIGQDNLLHILVQGATSAHSYDIQTEIALLNTKAITGLTSGQAIQYK